MDNEFFLYGRRMIRPKFKVVGFIPSVDFQKCKFLVEKLYVSYPKEYDKPEVESMLNLDWDEYLTKMKRRHGKPYYLLQSPVAVYFDGKLLGDDRALLSFMMQKYSLELSIDFEALAEKEIIRYFQDLIDKYKRKFVYLTIAIDEHVVGSLLFMLYNDLAPITCDNFLNRCTINSRAKGYSYKGTKVHRIAKYSWIQCGGFDLQETPMPCENYAVPHDRRGVLSMCNRKKHVENSTQFYITLNSASWMNCKYVAFGQLIQGAEVLNLIEKISTYYESPTRKIQITNCGEFSLCPSPDEEYLKALNPPYEALFAQDVKADDVDSILNEARYKAGKYALKTDLKAYLPFTRFSRMFDTYMRDVDQQELECTDDVRIEKLLKRMDKHPPVEEVASDVTLGHALKQLFRTSKGFYFDKHIIF